MPGFDPSDATLFKLKSFSNSTERAYDQEYSGRLDITVPVHLLGSDDAIKIGGKVRLRDKNDVPHGFGFTPPALLLSAVRGNGPFTDFYDGRYNIGYGPDLGALEQQAGQNLQGDPVGDAQGFFRDTENIYAGYAQYSATIGKLGLLAGVRVEHTRGTYRGITDTVDASGNDILTPSSRKSNYTDAFPTVQLRYAITPELVARATYSTGIGRPGFLQLLSGAQVDVANQFVTIGNPELKPTTVNAFDGVLEYYLPDAGVLSFGLFDKEFDDYVLARVERNVDYPGIGPGTTVNTFENVANSHARGVEAQYTQKFAHLAAPFDGLGFTGNVTYVTSRIEIRPGEFERLPGTARLTWNAGGFYEAHGVQVRVAAQHVDHTLYVVGGSAGADQFESARMTVDLTSSYDVSKHFQVYFNARNLTDAPLRIYEGSANRPIQREFYDVSYEAGARFRF